MTIRTPIQPIVHEQLTQIFCRHYGCTPLQGAENATKLLNTLRAYDLDVIRGDWLEMDKVGGPTTWDTLAKAADAFERDWNGIKPWNPPELQ